MKVFSDLFCPEYSTDEEFLQFVNFIKLIVSEVNLNISITCLLSNVCY